MKWIQVKMDQLGVSGNLNYKIAFMLDSKAMISVFAEQYGVVEVCKHMMLFERKIIIINILDFVYKVLHQR